MIGTRGGTETGNRSREEPTVLLSEETIRRRVTELGRRISEDYSRVENLHMVGVFRGSFIFLADLSRVLTIPRTIDFIAVASYEASGAPPGAVRLLMDVRTDIAGRHVLIVEDIVDTGGTLDTLVSLLAPRGPASLRSCALLSNPARRKKEVRIDYLGFEIPDRWVVGYGLDHQDRYRGLPYVGILPDAR